MSYEDTLEEITEIMADNGGLGNRYFVSAYTDGPAIRWNIIDRQTQEWIRRFPSEWEAKDYAKKLNADPVGQQLRAALAATDELVILANQYETRMQICENPKVVSAILANIQLLATLVEATNEKPAFKVIKNVR
jgi:hypothetical protein